MRKIWWIVAILMPASLYAEQMSFVTTLSSPYGVFSSLEVTDVNTPTDETQVFFGQHPNTPSGKIYIYGKESPYFRRIDIGKNSTMQGNRVQEFRVKSIKNFAPGVIKGKNLLVEKIQIVKPDGNPDDVLEKIHLSVNGSLYTHKLRVFGLQAENLCFVQAGKSGTNWEYQGGSKIIHGKDTSHQNGDPNNISPLQLHSPVKFVWTNKYQLQYFGITQYDNGEKRRYQCSDAGKGTPPPLKCALRTPVKVWYDEYNHGKKKNRVPYCPLLDYENGLRNHGCGYPEDVYLLEGTLDPGGIFPI